MLVRCVVHVQSVVHKLRITTYSVTAFYLADTAGYTDSCWSLHASICAI